MEGVGGQFPRLRPTPREVAAAGAELEIETRRGERGLVSLTAFLVAPAFPLLLRPGEGMISSSCWCIEVYGFSRRRSTLCVSVCWAKDFLLWVVQPTYLVPSWIPE